MKTPHFLITCWLFVTPGVSLSALDFGIPSGSVPGQSPQTTGSVSRQAPPRAILPGTRLDPRFQKLPPQDSTVARSAPAWLRAKVSGSPMYILDGQSATREPLRQLRPDDMASVNVLPAQKAVRLYGSNARNGLVILTTKAAVKPMRP